MDLEEGSDGLLHFLAANGRYFRRVRVRDPGDLMRDSAQAEKD